jgi:hypothetical protein
LDLIEQLNLTVLAATHRWRLRKDIENAVDIGYDVTSLSDRKILHHIGQRYGLIAACPGDVVDVEMSNGSIASVTRRDFLGLERAASAAGSAFKQGIVLYDGVAFTA